MPATTPGTGIDLTGVDAADLAAVVAQSAPTSHTRLVAWVTEVAALTTPGPDPLGRRQRGRARGARRRASSRRAPSCRWRRRRTPTGARATRATSRASRTARSSARSTRRTPARRTTGATRARCAPLMSDLYRGSMKGRTMYVIPFVMGHLDAKKPFFGVEISDSAYVVASMRIMARVGTDVLAVMGDGRRVRPVPALGRRAARARPGGRRVALQRHQVHRPLPRGARDLVVRLRLRRQRPARQEVLLAAHRLGHGARRGLARRAHAHPQADQPREQGPLRRRRLPERLRQDEPRDARSRRSRAGRSRRSATTSPGCASATTAGSTPSTRRTACSASHRAPAGTPTPTRCARSTRATASSPTSP